MKQIFLICITILTLGLIFQFIAWPEMTAWPYLLLNGWLPYRDIAIAHSPLLLVVLGLWYQFFGIGLIQLKIFTWLTIFLTSFLIYSYLKKNSTKNSGNLNIIIYVVLTFFFQGNGIWFDHILAPLGLLVYITLKSKKYFFAGFLLATACLVKQTAFWLVIPVSIELVLSRASLKSWIRVALGGLIPVISFFATLFVLGIYNDYIHWSLGFGIAKLPFAKGQIYFPSIKQFVFALLPFIACLFLLKSKKQIKSQAMLVVWICFASLGVYPRWELFHFQPALPFLALLISSNTIDDMWTKIKKVLYICGLIGLMLVFEFKYHTLMTNWFYDPEVQKIAEHIDSQAKDGQAIQVINGWDNLYVMSHTLPASKPLIPYLSWYMEQPGIQEEIVHDLDEVKPILIVRYKNPTENDTVYTAQLLNKFVDEHAENMTTIGAYEFITTKW